MGRGHDQTGGGFESCLLQKRGIRSSDVDKKGSLYTTRSEGRKKSDLDDRLGMYKLSLHLVLTSEVAVRSRRVETSRMAARASIAVRTLSLYCGSICMLFAFSSAS